MREQKQSYLYLELVSLLEVNYVNLLEYFKDMFLLSETSKLKFAKQKFT